MPINDLDDLTVPTPELAYNTPSLLNEEPTYTYITEPKPIDEAVGYGRVITLANQSDYSG